MSNFLVATIKKGKVKRARMSINASSPLGYVKAWSDRHALLCGALKNNNKIVAKRLLVEGSKPNNINGEPFDTPLHFAIIYCEMEMVKMLLDEGADINAKNQYGRTPLYTAIEHNKIEITELLLAYRADVNERDNNDISPLQVAIMLGHLEIIKHLLNFGADIDCECISSEKICWSPLHFAAKYYNKQVVTLLLCYGFNINIGGVNNITPLYIASERGSENAVLFLLKNGADVNACTNDNLTPLHIAIDRGHKSVVKLLLQYGANVDVQDKYGKTVLYHAIERGCLTIVQDVLEYRPDISNGSNRNFLETLVYGYNEECEKIAAALLEYGFTINIENSNISELLHVAIIRGYLKIVKYLLKYGIDVNLLRNSKSTYGFTPLHTAVQNQQEQAVKLLISYGADINVQDSMGKTPIFYAIENADVKITNLLLTNRAYVTEYPELLRIAVKNDCIEIDEALLQYDIDIDASDEYGRDELHSTVLTETDDFSRDLSVEDHDINVKAEIANLLLCKGANVDAETEDSVTALHVAVLKRYAEFVESLQQYNANVNYRTRDHNTPLYLDAKKGLQEITDTLLKCDADINSTDVYGRTPLYIACEENHNDVIKTLLGYSSKYDFIDVSNKALSPPGYSIAYCVERFAVSNSEFNDNLDEYEYDTSAYGDSCFYNTSGEEIVEASKRFMIKLKIVNVNVVAASFIVIP